MNPKSLGISLSEFKLVCTSKHLTEISFVANYNASMESFATDLVKTLCSECRSLTRVKIAGLPMTQETIDYLGDNLTETVEILDLKHLTFINGAVADSALIRLAKRLSNLVDLDISTVRIENARRAGKMFKYLSQLQKLALGEHKYYAVEPQRDWEEVYDIMSCLWIWAPSLEWTTPLS
jgi:hypothetical protein